MGRRDAAVEESVVGEADRVFLLVQVKGDPGDAQGGGDQNLLDGIAAEDGCAEVDAGLDPDTAEAVDNVAIAQEDGVFLRLHDSLFSLPRLDVLLQKFDACR